MKRLKSRITLLLLMAGLVFLGVLVFHRPVGLKPGPANIQPSPRSSDADTLRLLYSRSALTLNPHLATGFQDFEAARLVYEPLASYNQAGELTPVLAKDIPTQANGGVGENGATVTWELRPEVKWSDGQAFTADDVVFTFEFIHNPEVAAVTAQYYEAIKQVEALDDYRVKITFNQTDPAWATVFTGQTGLILPRHIFAQYNNGQARAATPNLQPVGTGPYQVVGFQTGTIIFEPNPTHWAGKPGFKRVEWLGGMAPYAAARDVLRAGTADVAPNLQVEATGLRDLEKDGKGHVVNLFGAQVERIMVNFANPFAQTEQGERSSATLPHPYFSDWRVRQAVNLAVDRNTISRDLYGAAGQPTAQVLVAPDRYQVPNLTYDYDLAKARVLLDQSGWIDSDGDGIRDKDGIPMKVLFQAPINPVRQRTQAIVSDRLKELGMDVKIARIRVDEFFSADPKDTDTLNHFYADLQLYATGNESPDPATYMGWWTCAKIASLANQWQQPNNARYCNRDYDRLWSQARVELDPQRRIQLFQQMNQLLTRDVAVIPIVHRAMVNAVSDRLSGVEFTPWDASTWKIKDWVRQDLASQ